MAPPLPAAVASAIGEINDLITTDAGGRGMKHLVVQGDLLASAEAFARLGGLPSKDGSRAHVVVLAGFPCCVDRTPPTETDGLASVAIARAALRMGYDATLLTEECNEGVYRAAVDGEDEYLSSIGLEFFPTEPSWTAESDARLAELAASADLVVACERAGPAADGVCYTMRGIDMNERGLIAPLHRVVTLAKRRGGDGGGRVKFIAIGDGGNELGMGKVIEQIHEHILLGTKIGSVLPADHLIAASVSNWGAYALIAAAALIRYHDEFITGDGSRSMTIEWVDMCLPTEESETQLIHRCVAAGCRDGVSGKREATVDGMPLERSMQCLRGIRKIAHGVNLMKVGHERGEWNSVSPNS